MSSTHSESWSFGGNRTPTGLVSAAVPPILTVISTFPWKYSQEMREYRPFKTVRPYLRGTDGRLARLAREPVVEGVEHQAILVDRSTTFLTETNQPGFLESLNHPCTKGDHTLRVLRFLCGLNAGDGMAGIGMTVAGPDARASPFASPANPPNRHRASASANARSLLH